MKSENHVGTWFTKIPRCIKAWKPTENEAQRTTMTDHTIS